RRYGKGIYGKTAIKLPEKRVPRRIMLMVGIWDSRRIWLQAYGLETMKGVFTLKVPQREKGHIPLFLFSECLWKNFIRMKVAGTHTAPFLTLQWKSRKSTTARHLDPAHKLTQQKLTQVQSLCLTLLRWIVLWRRLREVYQTVYKQKNISLTRQL